MTDQLSANDFAFLFSVILAFAVAGILFFSRHEKTYSIQLLASSYMSISGFFFIIFLLRTGLILRWPHFYRLGYLFVLMYLPLSYLYVRSCMFLRPFSKKDRWHAIPFFLYLFDYSGFFLSSGSYKRSILERELGNESLLLNLSQGYLLPREFYISLLALAIPAYWIAQAAVVIRARRQKSILVNSGNSYWMRWIVFYLTLQLVIFVPGYYIFLDKNPVYFFQISYVFSVINCLFICLSFFLHPGFLTIQHIELTAPSQREELVSTSSFEDKKETFDEKNEVIAPHTVKPLQHFSRKQIARMKFDIESLLERHQPYLQHGYSLQEMAASLKYPPYQLSALINQEYETNFNELINRYRIEHAIKLVKSGKVLNLNINGLSSACGFNNRNSFTSAFKKFTGSPPSEYFKSHNSE